MYLGSTSLTNGSMGTVHRFIYDPGNTGHPALPAAVWDDFPFYWILTILMLFQFLLSLQNGHIILMCTTAHKYHYHLLQAYIRAKDERNLGLLLI